jgi:hypothetical protein
MKKLALMLVVGVLTVGLLTRLAAAGEAEVDQLLNRGDIINLRQRSKINLHN